MKEFKFSSADRVVHVIIDEDGNVCIRESIEFERQEVNLTINELFSLAYSIISLKKVI
jgi:hypothetical protein